MEQCFILATTTILEGGNGFGGSRSQPSLRNIQGEVKRETSYFNQNKTLNV